VFLPPIELDDFRKAGTFHQGTVSEWNDRGGLITFGDSPQGRKIAVIIVIVADQNGIDFW